MNVASIFLTCLSCFILPFALLPTYWVFYFNNQILFQLYLYFEKISNFKKSCKTLQSKVAIYTSSRFINLHFVTFVTQITYCFAILYVYKNCRGSSWNVCVQTSTYTFFWTTWSKLQRSCLFTPESFRDTLLHSQLYTIFKIRKVNIYTKMIISNTTVCRPYSGFASCSSEVLEHIFLVLKLPKILHCI